MANVRDSDISLWLHNKLGSNEPWTSGSITSQLNAEVLRNIKECFIDLQTQVKLKLLLSFFHIPKRSVDEWKLELEEILEVAQADSEQWVAMLAEILKSFPTTNCLHIEITEPEENRRIFYDVAEEVTKEMTQMTLNLLPMECVFLNKSVLNSVVGPQKPPAQHFTVKTKLKSARLRKELMDRASDAAAHNLKKIPAPTIPLRTRGMPRKMTDTTPLKGIPSFPSSSRQAINPSVQNSSRTLGRPGEKKGGIKVLDITEQPLGFGAKRRRKHTENDDFRKGIPEDSIGSEPPDYAAGLPSSVRVPTPPPPTPLMIPPTPSSYQPPPTPHSLVNPPLSYARPNNVPTELSHLPKVIAITNDLPLPSSIPAPVIIQQPQLRDLRRALDTPTQSSQHPQPQLTKTVILQVPNNQNQNCFTLSKDLMEKAQAIFVTANKATRPEKEHIIKFMAGTRDNPCPELGNIVTIKLSEREELHPQRDGHMAQAVVETHFQMNYITGEWKVITKPPKFTPSVITT